MRRTSRWSDVGHAYRALAALLLLTLSNACISIHRPQFMSTPLERDWPLNLVLAQQRANEGKFELADSILAGFATRYPQTLEALETAYWRALFKLDPSNRSASFASAMSLLDTYLADKRPRENVDEATTLRRMAGQMDELNKLAAVAIAQAKVANDSAVSARTAAADAKADPKLAAPPEAAAMAAEQEIKRLKDELAKANAELERIRRRLAQPPSIRQERR
jgi:hypothetical protein